jgi:ABC-2 type transport system permease protein
VEIYFKIIGFSFLRFFSYPFELLAQVTKRVIEIAFLVLFWSVYIKSSGQNLSLPQIVSYFLIALGVADLTMARWGALGNLIGNQIKSGQISNLVIKPVNLIFSLYAMSLGRNGLRLMLAVVNIIAGLAIHPPQSFYNLALFFLFFLNSIVISFAYNVLEGTLFLHFTDASGIRNSIQNFMRLLTGTMIPLYLFPSPLKEILRFSPFPSMVYLPANSLSGNLDQFGLDFTIGIAWAIVLNIAAFSFWNYSMKKYEAVGI